MSCACMCSFIIAEGIAREVKEKISRAIRTVSETENSKRCLSGSLSDMILFCRRGSTCLERRQIILYTVNMQEFSPLLLTSVVSIGYLLLLQQQGIADLHFKVLAQSTIVAFW